MWLRYILRRLRRDALYSGINAFSLAIGTCLLLLGVLYWHNEHHYDRFHKSAADLYRITSTTLERKGDQPKLNGGTGQVQGPAFQAEIPEILGYTRLLGGGISSDVRVDGNSFRSKILFADSSFFSLFSFPLLKGNPRTALTGVSSVVITEAMAMKFFNSTDVLGKSLEMIADPSAKQLGRPMIITGVAANLPGNSSIRFDLLLPMQFMQLSFTDQSWLNAYLGTFVLLKPGADKGKLIRQFNEIFASRAREQVAAHVRTYGFNPIVTYGLQPVSDIHLHPLEMSMESGVTDGSDPLYSQLFLGIGLFVMGMAAINFINISIAGSLKRAKEIGMRKISGGSALQVMLQFIAESAVLCSFAFLAAAGFAVLCLPVFNRLTDKNIQWRDLTAGGFPFWSMLIFPLITLSAALYPGWIVSRFSPREVLYRKQKLSTGQGPGKMLVVLQFAIATFLIIASSVYYRQMQFIKTQGPGYNAKQVLTASIEGDRAVAPVFSLIRNELGRSPSIQSVSLGGGQSVYPVKFGDRQIEAMHKVIDENYLPLMEIPLRAGRNLSAAFPSDSSKAVLVNEAFVRAAGLEKPLGVQIQTDEYFDRETKTIVGVVKDFHTGSFREPIRPMVLFMNKWYPHDIFARIVPGRKKDAEAVFATAFKTAMPEAVMNLQFLDEHNANQYAREERWQEIVGWSALLSVAICCLGLFGLAHLSATQRTKEIGIRKTLGASVFRVAVVLSSGFLKLVLVAIGIAVPFGGFVMRQWLDGFVYRSNLGWPAFLFSGLLAFIVALLTVGIQAIRAGRASPVGCLRTE